MTIPNFEENSFFIMLGARISLPGYDSETHASGSWQEVADHKIWAVDQEMIKSVGPQCSPSFPPRE
jgi:hypothetical protein